MRIINKHIEETLKFVAEEFNVDPKTLKHKTRLRSIVFPRQIAMYLCAKYIAGASYNLIGAVIGGKDHSTVLYSKNTIEGIAETKTSDGSFVRYIEGEFTQKLLPVIRSNSINSDEYYKRLHQEYDVATEKYNESVDLMYACSIECINFMWGMIKNDNSMEGWRKKSISDMIDKSKKRLKKQKELVSY